MAKPPTKDERRKKKNDLRLASSRNVVHLRERTPSERRERARSEAERPDRRRYSFFEVSFSEAAAGGRRPNAPTERTERSGENVGGHSAGVDANETKFFFVRSEFERSGENGRERSPRRGAASAACPRRNEATAVFVA